MIPDRRDGRETVMAVCAMAVLRDDGRFRSIASPASRVLHPARPPLTG